MRWMARVTTGVIVLLAGAQALPLDAQVLLRSATTSPTTDQLLARIVALEARVAQLESMLSMVSGQVVLDGKGAPVVVRGSSITIQPDGMLTLRAGNSVSIGSSASLSLRAGGPLAVESFAGLDLKGSTIMLNNGSKPVACAGAVTNSVLGTVPHLHLVTGQGCGTTVLVP